MSGALAYAHERLNPTWILAWIKDPQALMPGTKMPAFYPGGPPDVFDGDEDKQVAAMRDYIMSLGTQELTAKVEDEPAPVAGPDGGGAAETSEDAAAGQAEASAPRAADLDAG